MVCNTFSLVELIIKSRNATFMNSKEFVITHFCVCLKCNFSRKAAQCADTWTNCWPLPLSHPDCTIFTACSPSPSVDISVTLSFLFLLSPIPYFCPPHPPLSPVLSPSDPPPLSTPPSCCRTPPVMELHSWTQSRTHARTQTHIWL